MLVSVHCIGYNISVAQCDVTKNARSLSTPPPPISAGGISTGAAVGIAVGAAVGGLVLAAIIAFLVSLLIITKRRREAVQMSK